MGAAAPGVTPLARLLRRRIARHGPITVERYMALALGHPRHGYYRHRDPLGAAGDFITAPEISQMFGELIGLWCAAVWRMMGAPASLRLVELGPGRGTLMADLLRAAASVPVFAAALDIHLVETSPALRRRQRQALPDRRVFWHDDLAEVPAGPMLLVANEFFDALPVRQFVRLGDAWRERMVDLDAQGGLRFAAGPVVDPAALPAAIGTAPEGAVAEVCPAARGLAAALGGRLAGQGGAALIVDYGHERCGVGETLQAVRRHAYRPVLSDPGEADLTAHVDFASLAEAARPAAAHGPLPQGVWLRRLGIEPRAAALSRAAPGKAGEIAAACRRLIHPREMGSLFKVLALADGRLPTLPGFDPDE